MKIITATKVPIIYSSFKKWVWCDKSNLVMALDHDSLQFCILLLSD